MVAEEGAIVGENMLFYSGLCGREMVAGDELIVFTNGLIKVFCVVQWWKNNSNVLADRTMAEEGVTVGKIYVLMKVVVGELTPGGNESAMVTIVFAWGASNRCMHD